MTSVGLQEERTMGSQDNGPTNPKPKPKPAEQPKKQFPSFWRTLKHPSPNSLAPECLTDPLKTLTDQQRETYDYLVNTLNSPAFELPKSSSPTTSNPINSMMNQTQSLEESLKLTEIEKCYCSRECLLRVCRSTGWDSSRALKRLTDTLIWRRDFQVDQIDYRELWEAAGTGVEFTIGYDNRQRPLLYMFPNKQTAKPTSNQIKLLVWYLERTIDLMPPGVETLTLMIDFASPENNSKSSPAPISTAKEVLKILQTYYCERLGQAICVNVPWMFWGFFKILKPFLDSKTAQKVLFDPLVTDHVPVEQLLKEGFQGDLDFHYDHETYFPLLAELTAHRRQRMLARYKRLAHGMVGISEFELRGGARRSKNARREMSIGSETSTQLTHPGSPPAAAYRQRAGSEVAEVFSRSPPGIAFRSSAKLASSFTPHTYGFTSASGRLRTRSAMDPQRSIRDNTIIASHPSSLNSLSSPLTLPTSQDHKNINKKVTRGDKKHSKTKSSITIQSYSKPSNLNPGPGPQPCSPLTASLSPTIENKSIKNRLLFLSHSSNHDDHHHCHKLIDLNLDGNGRVQTDSMSCSRRINEVSV